MLAAYLELARPKEWVKNAFALVPVPFAVAGGAVLRPLPFVLGLLAFSAAASSIYALNDAQDAQRDAAHDKKRYRPIPSGRVSITGARVWSAFLMAIGVALAWATGSQGALIIVISYLVVNAFYSLVGKHISQVDVFLLSSFYAMRVLLGCALLGVTPSSWLLLCTCAVALFIGFAKRRSDLIKGLDETHRPSLVGYSAGYLTQGMAITAATTIVAYAMYTMDSKVLLPGREFLSVPFVAFVVLEYLRIVHVKGEGTAPVELVLHSPGLIFAFFGWLVATVWGLGLIPV